MAGLSWSEAVALDAGVSAVSVLAQAMIVELVDGSVDPVMFGGADAATFKLARAALAAHLGRLALPGEAAAAGPVASKSADGLSKSYFQMAASSPDALDETRWGRVFKGLCASSAARAGLVI